jgi:hypothetical protein
VNSKRNEPYTAIKKPVELLFGSSTTATQPDSTVNATNTVAINKIHLPTSQPRRYFDEHKLKELSRSIKEHEAKGKITRNVIGSSQMLLIEEVFTALAVQEQLSDIGTVYPPVPKTIAFADASERRVPLTLFDKNHPAISVLKKIANSLDKLELLP